MAELHEIESKLWAMANQLRGSMDASEYKNYILAFMFYRYLSERQENYLVDESGLFSPEDRPEINEIYKEEAQGEELNDYLENICMTLGYAIRPEDTWKSLVDRVKAGEIVPSDFQDLFDHFNDNVQINPDSKKDFRGIFDDINLGDTRLGANTNERAKALSRIVELVDSVDYKGEDGQDVLGAIYEYLIGQFAASAGKKGGEFYTPHEVSQILAKIVVDDKKDLDRTFSVYDPTCGSGSLLLTVQNELPGGDRKGAVHFYGQEMNTTTYNLARMNLMMNDVNYINMDLRNADTLGPDWPDGKNEQGIDSPRYFDAVVANPPYSAHWDNNPIKLEDPRFQNYGKLAPKTKADYAFVLHGLYHLNQEGTMAVVLPHGVLFRGAAEAKIRQTLIDNHQIYAVIGLPANLFYGVGIPTIIMVLKKDRESDDVLFIDASKEFEKGKNQNRLTQENIDKIIETYRNREDVERYAHLATLEEIKENDYNLNIPRYVDTTEEEEPIDLQEVLGAIRKDQEEIDRLEGELNEQLKILGVL